MKLPEGVPVPPVSTVFGPVVQVAFHAPDIAAEAERWARQANAGPFYLMERIALRRVRYRDRPGAFLHSSAYGQFGDLMLELIHQHDDDPSCIRDMYDARTAGWHHVAVFVDDIPTTLKEAERRNMATTLDAETAEGVRFAMVDGRNDHGLMLEFYQADETMERFYAFIRRKSLYWDGADPLRRLGSR